MKEIDRDDLPYPHAYIAITRMGGDLRPVEVDALTPGTAQWKQAYYRSGGRISDSEGVLALTQEAVIYRDIEKHEIKPSWRPKMRKMVLRGSDLKVRMWVEEQVAINAVYI